MTTKPNNNCCSPKSDSKRSGKIANKTDQLAIFTKALGHPIRIQILNILKKKKSCICGDLVDELPIAQATVSQHLKVLKTAGLIKGTIAGPATCYCIDEDALNEFKTLIKEF